MEAQPSSYIERLSVQRIVLWGFGLILVLWIFLGFGLARSLAEVRENLASLNTRFLDREQRLFRLRAEVLLGGIYVRDALLDDTPGSDDHYLQLLEQAYRAIETNLAAEDKFMNSPQERRNWARLRKEIDAYWGSLSEVFSWDDSRQNKEGHAWLQLEVIPKREQIMRISGQIQSLEQQAFSVEHAELEQVYLAQRQWVWQIITLAVMLAMAIALGVIRYAGRLEAIIRQQHAQAVEHQRALQRLSGSLVHAQEEERRSISRELHDEVGQALTAIKMALAPVERGVQDNTRLQDFVNEARSIADHTLQSVRDLSQMLHPSMLDELGLPDTLTWHTRSFSRRTGIRAVLLQDREIGRLATEIEVSAYRIIQEGLTNVARHSEAAECTIELRSLPNTLRIIIEDKGRGFDAKHPAGERGLGLAGIRERVSGLGGEFRLESQPGKGVRLTVELPAIPAASVSEPGEESASEPSHASTKGTH